MPILIGFVVLVLVGLIGFGVWMIVKSAKDAPATPVQPTPSAAPATTRESVAPTSAAPVTTPPSSAPAESTDVPIPALMGLSLADAQQALKRVGLTYRVIYRSSAAAPGTVIDSDPPEGREVPKDTEVTLVIAAAPSSAPAASPSVTTSGNDAGLPDED
jgi:hypothetical protein